MPAGARMSVEHRLVPGQMSHSRGIGPELTSAIARSVGVLRSFDIDLVVGRERPCRPCVGALTSTKVTRAASGRAPRASSRAPASCGPRPRLSPASMPALRNGTARARYSSLDS